MEKHYDVIIVGAGSMGMAAGYYLAKQGINTLLVDSFDPPHVNGSHHGDTRIIRHAYGEGREYVPLAIRAQTLWYELEKEANQKVFHQTGVLGFGPKGSAFIDEAIASANEYSLQLEILQGTEIMERWPGITLPEDYLGCFEPASGVLFSEDCIRAYRKLAIESGATLLTNTQVEDIDIHESSSTIHTASGSYSADKLIISGGAWNKKILSSLKLDLPLQPKRQTVGWFESDEALYQSSVFPAFFVDMPIGIYYGFPSFDGAGLKIGRHDFGQDIDPDTINREFGIYPEDEDYIRNFLKTHMPQAEGKINQGRVCMYTKTPDEHFIVDLHPEYSHVIIAAGFSGHGFKFASVIGEILSQLAKVGQTEHDISLFSLKRPVLQKNLQN
ncbi:N-methyl-L-tryptophan oxidase [Bacillus sp. 03113]|uniref:N-methyl-L-tryptophan oxidase n=1 Tax=Bacillus sp. 03113 TaxID=2578211 RepID=UPI001144B297|nr:N-methyl-L-tryptophan oxidase [Bacillus sp. 03113]